MEQKEEAADDQGRTVFELGNITFLDIGTLADYTEAIGVDLTEYTRTRFIRYGISRKRHFVLGRAT